MRMVAIRHVIAAVVPTFLVCTAPAQEMPNRNMATRSSLKPAAEWAPVLKVFDTGETPRELAAFRPRNVLLVFFLGAECSHCTQNLRELLRDAREAGGGNVEIVAISSWRVASPAAAREMLGVTSADHFHLLVDETQRSFRDYGCYNGKPMHGLFLIDRDGVIRVKYAGESPYADTREAARLARQLVPAKP
ncbi:MAG TPA: redoxin domain-containing protein [Gemmataceae bacterium]|jgi:peroxiredoxin|nr:redoxin domain-containing protein [Gemmataceae bacterium]